MAFVKSGLTIGSSSNSSIYIHSNNFSSANRAILSTANAGCLSLTVYNNVFDRCLSGIELYPQFANISHNVFSGTGVAGSSARVYAFQYYFGYNQVFGFFSSYHLALPFPLLLTFIFTDFLHSTSRGDCLLCRFRKKRFRKLLAGAVQYTFYRFGILVYYCLANAFGEKD